MSLYKRKKGIVRKLPHHTQSTWDNWNKWNTVSYLCDMAGERESAHLAVVLYTECFPCYHRYCRPLSRTPLWDSYHISYHGWTIWYIPGPRERKADYGTMQFKLHLSLRMGANPFIRMFKKLQRGYFQIKNQHPKSQAVGLLISLVFFFKMFFAYFLFLPWLTF